jgi:putative tryptophan/tyrosine transport system substrate-binding protein
MDRRRFLLSSLAGVVAAPLAAQAQQDKSQPQRVGVLAGNPPDTNLCLAALKAGLADFGYMEGKTHSLELRWTDGDIEPFPKLARELVQLNVDVIVALTALAIPAVRAATSVIPIVMASSSYPDELGLIRSLSRPGGNVTGIANFTPELMQKRVQILKEAVPSAQRVAVLRLAGPIQDLYLRDLTIAAHRLGIELQVIQVQHVSELPSAFETATRGKAQAVMSTQGPFFGLNTHRIAQLALKHKLPGLSGEQESAAAGTLLFYGPYIRDGCLRAAYFVDKLLKGARPADLPVEQPVRFRLNVNLKTAKALGLTIPPSLLARADQIIE